MFTKNKIPVLLALTLGLEIVIYFWAVWTTEIEFIFNKCARNSGRVSSAIILVVLAMVGHYGLKKIYSNTTTKDGFRVLMTVFTFNHLIHFFYVFMTFKHHALTLGIADNKHGFITFICIVIIPFIIWFSKNLTRTLYIAIIIHLFNVSYFINHTFLSKVKPDKPAYHNQLGIVLITIALIYILYRIFIETKTSSQRSLR